MHLFRRGSPEFTKAQADRRQFHGSISWFQPRACAARAERWGLGRCANIFGRGGCDSTAWRAACIWSAQAGGHRR
jgi:hypothetical protein